MSIAATRIEHLAPDKTRACRRCGRVLNSPRPGGQCMDCQDTVALERSLAHHGLDPLEMTDEQLERFAALRSNRTRLAKRIRFEILARRGEVA